MYSVAAGDEYEHSVVTWCTHKWPGTCFVGQYIVAMRKNEMENNCPPAPCHRVDTFCTEEKEGGLESTGKNVQFLRCWGKWGEGPRLIGVYPLYQ